MKYTEFAKAYDSHRKATIAAYDGGWKLNKYADPEEGPLKDMHPSYAEQVAQEDPALIWMSKRPRR